MKRRLFLCGEIGCGKSTMIQNALGAAIGQAGGFVTRRIAKGGELKGFELLPAEASAERQFERRLPRTSGRCFLSFSDSLKKDDTVFSEYAPALLRKAQEYPFAVLDEIGGVELLEQEFWEELQRFLRSETPCVGVLKTMRAARALEKRIHPGERYAERYEELKILLANDADTELCLTAGWQDAQTEQKLKRWAENYSSGRSGEPLRRNNGGAR